jgi:hypothetical protein
VRWLDEGWSPWRIGVGTISLVSLGVTVYGYAAHPHHPGSVWWLLGAALVMTVWSLSEMLRWRVRHNRLRTQVNNVRAGPPSVGPRPSGRLSSPQDGSKVRHHQVVSGTVSHLRPDAEAWIVVLPTVEGTYWPQFNLSKGHRSGFQNEVWFGGQGRRQYTGAEYTLQLVMAYPDASARFREFQGKDALKGMPELPAGVELLDQVTVTRL